MRKINKRYITALMVTVVGIVSLPSPAYTLRVPNSFQDESRELADEFNIVATSSKRYRYYGPGDKCYYQEPNGSLRARDMDKQTVIEGLLRIPSIRKSFRKEKKVTVFNLGSGAHPFRSFDNYDITNFDPDFPFQTNAWRPSEKAAEHGAKFGLKEITDIKDKCSIGIWHDLPYFIDYHAERTSIWKDTSGDGRERERQVIEKSLRHTWEIIDEGGYFVITTSRIDEYEGFYANDVYGMVKELGFDVSEVHVVGKSIKEAKTIILRKASNTQTELASGETSTTIKLARQRANIFMQKMSPIISNVREMIQNLKPEEKLSDDTKKALKALDKEVMKASSLRIKDLRDPIGFFNHYIGNDFSGIAMTARNASDKGRLTKGNIENMKKDLLMMETVIAGFLSLPDEKMKKVIKSSGGLSYGIFSSKKEMLYIEKQLKALPHLTLREKLVHIAPNNQL